MEKVVSSAATTNYSLNVILFCCITMTPVTDYQVLLCKIQENVTS